MLVEGAVDIFSVVGLMREHVDWPKARWDAPVWILNGGGRPNVFEKNLIPTYLKSFVIRRFGIIVDADDNAAGTYQRIHQLCGKEFPQLPTQLSADGIIVENDDGKTLGVWIMPDNHSDGGIETFLKSLIPESEAKSWELAQQCVQSAKQLGCPCRDCHEDKANLYTWLAWRDPPGQSPGVALMMADLNGTAESAGAFVAWFKKLYDLPAKSLLIS
jgi:hypothetical protein